MRTKVLALVSIALLLACRLAVAANQYQPAESPLRPGSIQPFDVAGTVTVSNGQSSTDELIVYSKGFGKWSSNLNAITETMVQQARSEIAKNGRVTAGGKPKTIELKVNSLRSEYKSFAHYYSSKMQFQVKLGDGQTIDKPVTHRSALALQDLNGCIAEGVMLLLKDEKVLAYLAQ